MKENQVSYYYRSIFKQSTVTKLCQICLLISAQYNNSISAKLKLISRQKTALTKGPHCCVITVHNTMTIYRYNICSSKWVACLLLRLIVLFLNINA